MATVDKITTGPGTLGRLSSDSKLYQDMLALMERLDSLIEDFKKNPRKYIKLSIF